MQSTAAVNECHKENRRKEVERKLYNKDSNNYLILQFLKNKEIELTLEFVALMNPGIQSFGGVAAVALLLDWKRMKIENK